MRSTIIKEGNTHPYKRRRGRVAVVICLAWLLASSSMLRAQTNHALDFDGTDDYVDLPAAAYFTENNFTIEAWVYPRAYNSWSRVIDFSNGPASDNILMAVTDGATGFPAGSVFNGGDGTNYTANKQLELNTWSHLAVVVDGSNARIYINGVLNSSHSGITEVVDVERTLNYIGKSAWGDELANAMIDELKIWNRALGPAHIANHRYKKPAPGEEGLVVYFDFEQGVAGGDNTSITSLIDKSGNDYHGTFRNFELDGAGSNFVTGVDISGEAVYLLDPDLTTPETSFTKSVLDEAFVLSATSSSPAPFTYSLVSGTSVSVEGATVEINEAGTSVVRIHQAADAGYEESSVYVTINITSVPADLDGSVVLETVGRYSYSVASGDLNGDGVSDMAAAFYGTDNVLVYINNGTGAFRDPVSYEVGSHPKDIVISDLDGDGKPDIATANSGDNTVSVLINTGTGAFNQQATYEAGDFSQSITPGDFNGDGKLDLATANTNENTVSVLINTGTGTFDSQVKYDVGVDPENIVAGDLDGDGKLDLAITNIGNYSVSVLINTGTGTFHDHVQSHAGFVPGPLAIGDLDGDGKLDLVSTNLSDHKISVLINTGTGDFNTPVQYAAGLQPAEVAISDLNGDDKPDLTVANFDDGQFSVLINDGTGAFNTVVTYGRGVYHYGLAIGDWNADTKPDVVVTSIHNNTLSTFLNTGNGVFGDATKIHTAFSYISLATGDLNSDGQDDLVIGTGGNALLVKMNLGDNTYALPVIYEVGGECYPLLGDVNGDGKLDVVTANVDDNSVSVLINPGNGALNTPVTQDTGAEQLYKANLGDVNGDGKPDLVTIDSDNNKVSVWINTGTGTFSTPVAYDVGSEPSSVAIGDLNGDGKLDLATANYDAYTVSVLINTGTGTFDDHVMYDVDREPRKIVMADLNGDGKLDLATANQDGRSISVLTNAGTGTFEPAIRYGLEVDPTDVTIADMNGEGKPDLVVAFNREYISVLNNTGDGFETESQYSLDGSPSTLVTANLNNDGRPDIAGVSNNDAFTYLNETISLTQTISFAALGEKNYGDAAFDLTATASSSLSVTYTSSNTAVATIDGSKVTIVGTGTTTIEASQNGRGFYGPASAVEQSFTVNKANQTIAFAALANKTLGDASFALTATASSTLAIAYTSANDKATVNGSQVTLAKAGRATITAVQAGNTNYVAATSVEQSFCINPAKPVITEDFTNPEAPVLTSSVTTGNQWYKNNELISGATGNTFTVTAPGTYTVIVTVENCASESSAGAGAAITGLEDASSSVISISPNPAHQQIEIHFGETGEKQLEIISVHGHVIHQAVVSGEKTSVSVGDYTPGVYIVKARTPNHTYRTRFIRK